MKPVKKDRFNKRTGAAVIAVIALLAGLLWSDGFRAGFNKIVTFNATRQVEGQIFGLMPDPLQPDLLEPALEPITPPKNTKKVVIKRIPRIDKDMNMVHPYWGECDRCHLLTGGPPAGSQWITPFGKALEKVSTIKKVGPPVLPNSTRPHPAAGRCIKCHDIVIDVPV